MKIPILLVNARLSDKSCRGYKRFGGFTRQVLRRISSIAAQTESDAQRFIDLGAEADRVVITGNLKFEVEIQAGVVERGRALRGYLGTDDPVWIAASTHAREEEIVLAAHRRVSDRFPGCKLILAPRHPERCADVARLCQESGFQSRHVSRLPSTTPGELSAQVQVLLVDTIGELPVYYAAADVAFVGGSLLPGMGGHNVLEPACLGIPVITGAHTGAFMEINRILGLQQAIKTIAKPELLADEVLVLFADHAMSARMGNAGIALVQQNRGSTDRVMRLIVESLDRE